MNLDLNPSSGSPHCHPSTETLPQTFRQEPPYFRCLSDSRVLVDLYRRKDICSSVYTIITSKQIMITQSAHSSFPRDAHCLIPSCVHVPASPPFLYNTVRKCKSHCPSVARIDTECLGIGVIQTRSQSNYIDKMIYVHGIGCDGELEDN